MLRLTLAKNEIELYENEPVNLSYQFSDIQEINGSRSSFSQTFRVPLTKKNQDYFGAVNEFGLIPNWNPKTKVDAELSYNSIPLIRGFAQVKGVYIQKGKYADVELVIFGETANLSRDIGDGYISELDLSAYNHTLNATNIKASWAGTLIGGAIRYGIPDKGQNWTNSNIWSDSDPLEHGDFTPYIQANRVLMEILEKAGYTYTSTWLDNFSDLYLACYKGQRAVYGGDLPELETMTVGLTSDLTGLSAHTAFASITAFSEATPFFDTGANFSGGSTYTVPYRAYYTFRINIYGRADHDNDLVQLRLAKNGTTELWEFFNDFSILLNDQILTFTSEPLLLNTGDQITLQYKLGSSGHTLDLDGDNTTSPNSTWWQVLEISDPTSGQTVDVAANLPEMKRIDFVSGLQKMFNLVFIPDKNKPKHLYIEPFADYIASGRIEDWTNKIDLSKDISIVPTTDIQARKYEWTHTNGKDLVNDLVFKNAARVYGRYRVDDPDNDFASGTKEVKTPFAPHVVSYIPGTAYATHRMLVDTSEADKTIKDPLPRLAFWNGTIAGNIAFNTDDNLNSPSPERATSYPVFSNFSDYYASVNDEDLSFGAERPFHIIEANPLETLYYKYWRPWVNELYSSDARKLTAFFRLTRADLSQFEYSDKIYIKDTYWRVLSIQYDATTEGLAKVEMLKVLGDIRDCEYLPISINKADGRIRFESSTGSQVYQISPTYSSCCTKYGYVYDSSDGSCYQKQEQ